MFTRNALKIYKLFYFKMRSVELQQAFHSAQAHALKIDRFKLNA